jgi:cobalt-zinc-cadmium efflux system membrane fusion protein
VVREGDGSQTAWVTADRRRFEKRTIRTGLVQNGLVQVIDGLAPGTLVVVDGGLFLTNKLAGGPAD